MTRTADMEGVQTDYCTDTDLDRNRAAQLANDQILTARFSNKTACHVPGGLDGDRDAVFFQAELIDLVHDGILPVGIRCYICGELHEVAREKRSLKLRRVER